MGEGEGLDRRAQENKGLVVSCSFYVCDTTPDCVVGMVDVNIFCHAGRVNSLTPKWTFMSRLAHFFLNKKGATKKYPVSAASMIQ